MGTNSSQEMKSRSDGIRHLLIHQFALHEVAHHPSLIDSQDADAVTVPKAHDISDIYKCLHQGVFGVGHNIQSPADFKYRLANEMRAAGSRLEEPTLESVSPDGSVLRVNLRPFRSHFAGEEEKGCELLAQVCVQSAAIETGTPEAFFGVLDMFRELNSAGEIKAGGRVFAFADTRVQRFLLEVKKFLGDSGFIPVLSHSPVYRSLNSPSYRVVHERALRSSPLAFIIQ